MLSSISDKILALGNLLYPRGRAFNIGIGSIRESINIALSITEVEAYTDARNLLNFIIADNVNFIEVDADIWERRLGIPNGTGLAIQDRRDNILRKYAFPGTVEARSASRFMERELQAAGFTVFIYENRFDIGGGVFESRTVELAVGAQGVAVYSDEIEYGEVEYAELNEVKVVNSLDQAVDDAFDFVGNYERTFFIAGATISTRATVPIARQTEFRQLILRLKPLHTVGFLFVDFT